MKRIFGLALAFLTVVLPMCFTSCGSDDTQMTAIKLSITKIENPQIGDNDTITATITPTDATNPNVTWTHSNDSVLKITSNGNTAIITILDHGNDSVFCYAAEGNGVRSVCLVTYQANPDGSEPDTTTISTQ